MRLHITVLLLGLVGSSVVASVNSSESVKPKSADKPPPIKPVELEKPDAPAKPVKPVEQKKPKLVTARSSEVDNFVANGPPEKKLEGQGPQQPGGSQQPGTSPQPGMASQPGTPSPPGMPQQPGMPPQYPPPAGPPQYLPPQMPPQYPQPGTPSQYPQPQGPPQYPPLQGNEQPIVYQPPEVYRDYDNNDQVKNNPRITEVKLSRPEPTIVKLSQKDKQDLQALLNVVKDCQRSVGQINMYARMVSDVQNVAWPLRNIGELILDKLEIVRRYRDSFWELGRNLGSRIKLGYRLRKFADAVSSLEERSRALAIELKYPGANFWKDVIVLAWEFELEANEVQSLGNVLFRYM